MVEIAAFETYKGDGQPTSKPLVWTTIIAISASNLVANSKYIVWAKTGQQTQNATAKIEHRIIAEGAEVTGTFGSNGQTSGFSSVYDSIGLVETGGVPTDIEFQYQFDVSPGGSGFFPDNHQIFAMLLTNDLREITDYRFNNENVNEVVDNSAFETKASVTFGADQAGPWLILGQIRTLQPATPHADGIEYRVSLDGATSGANAEPSETLIRNQSAVADGTAVNHKICRVYPTLPSGTHTVAIEVKSVSANTDFEYNGSSLFALNLSRFENVVTDFVAGAEPITFGREELVNESVTPTVADSNFLMIFGGRTSNTVAAVTPVVAMQLNGVQIDSDPIGSGDDDDQPSMYHTAGAPFCSHTFLPIPTGSNDTDVDMSNSGAVDISARSFALFSMELVDVRKVQGTILEGGVAVARKVVAYRAVAPFEKVGETTSDAGTGAFSILNLPVDDVDVVVRDDDAGDSFNALIFAKVTPVAI